MSEAILEFFSGLPRELYIFIISMLPIVELRGAIPVGAAIGLDFYINYTVAIIGNLVPVPFILLFISKILNFLSRFKIFAPMVSWLRKKASRGSHKMLKKVSPQDSGKDFSAEPIKANESITPPDDAIASPSEALADQTSDALPEHSEALNDRSIETVGGEIEIVADQASDTSSEQSAPAKASLDADNVSFDYLCIDNQAGSNEPASASVTDGDSRRLTPAIFAALALFVAVPLPGTGAWTGALISALFNFPRRHSFLAIAIGVMLSGIIMTLASYGVVGFLSIFL